MKLTVKGILVAALSVALTGCEGISLSFSSSARPAAPAAATTGGAAKSAPDPAPDDKEPPLDYMANSAVREDDGGNASGAVDTALELSRKYAEVAEQLMAVQKSNKALTQENRKLLGQVAKLEMVVSQAQRELDDANEQIMAQKRALQEWKDNVMGFREDMQKLEEVQIEALGKILQLLNGETLPATGAAVGKPGLSAKDTTSDSTGKNSG